MTYLGGYRVLYLVSAVIGMAGALLVRRIRGWTEAVRLRQSTPASRADHAVGNIGR